MFTKYNRIVAKSVFYSSLLRYFTCLFLWLRYTL